ncbi:hypothetical protein RDV78_06335 [Bacillota bacterium LX-D]|nr:hypothetical protein [Bacillota bacterium LX-D]
MLGQAKLMILILFLGLFNGWIIRPIIFNFLVSKSLVSDNYKGKKVITAAGISLFFSFITTVFTLELIKPEQEIPLLLLWGVSLVSMVGFWDDIWEDSHTKGLKGHIKALTEGRLTTGAMKAIVGLLVAFFVSRNFSTNLFSLALNILILALTINALNLFDLRPGRAIKIFYIAFFGLLFTHPWENETLWLLALAGTLFVYAPWDLSGRAMLGDTGSNLLGFFIGYNFVVLVSTPNKILIVLFLLLVHWYSEHYSLTELISKRKLLNFLDRLGRPEV